MKPINKKTRARKEDVPKRRQNFPSAVKSAKCYNCGKEGDYARDCKTPPKASRTPRKFPQNQVRHIYENTLDFDIFSVDSREENHIKENLKSCPKVEAMITDARSL